jgi:hypothetical protein
VAKNEEYYIHKIDEKSCRITKMIHGEPVPSSTYTTSDHDCQCYQAQRGECRHMRMRRAWILRKISPLPAIVNYDRDTIEPVTHDD